MPHVQATLVSSLHLASPFCHFARSALTTPRLTIEEVKADLAAAIELILDDLLEDML